jgi:hypothetical protein
MKKKSIFLGYVTLITHIFFSWPYHENSFTQQEDCRPVCRKLVREQVDPMTLIPQSSVMDERVEVVDTSIVKRALERKHARR